jgi:hypothetical protein
MRTRSPGWRSAWSVSACQAVGAATGSDAACASRQLG